MSEAKHTPAPLDLYVAYCDTIRGQEPRIRDNMLAIRDNNTGKEIAILTANGRPKQELEKLANQFASAPELLEALERLTFKAEARGCLPKDMSNDAREAIAKAKGQS